MIEPARRHGPFDPRYPRRQPRATDAPASARAATNEEADDRLDWRAFSARHFPGRRRHDLEALAAFEAYGNGSQEWPGDELEGGDARAARRNGRPSSIAEIGRAEAALVSTAVQEWESEGGAALATAGNVGIR